MVDITYREYLSEADNRVAQLMDILEAITGDRGINVGYPTDAYEDWQKANAETFARITRMNMVAHWAGEWFTSLYYSEYAGKGGLAALDVAPLGAGLPNDSLENLEAIAILIGIESHKLQSTMTVHKVRWNDHFENPHTKPIRDYQEKLFFDFHTGVRKLEKERARAKR